MDNRIKIENIEHNSNENTSPVPLPAIEIRRPSALSQFEFHYLLNSPEITGAESFDYPPIIINENCFKKSFDGMYIANLLSIFAFFCTLLKILILEISFGGSCASSSFSHRSSRSSGAFRLSTFSFGTSFTSENSTPILYTMKKGASTIGSRLMVYQTPSQGDSLRVPSIDREVFIFAIEIYMNILLLNYFVIIHLFSGVAFNYKLL